MRSGIKPYYLFPFFILALVAGIVGGLVRAGWSFPFENATSYHGLLMTGGFLGGLITLERTVTKKDIIWLLFPLSCGISVIFLLIGQPQIASWLLTVGSIGLFFFYLKMPSQFGESHWVIMTIGSGFWIIGNIKYVLTEFVPLSVNWWIGFILFTIVGERLELTRFLPVKKYMKRVLWIILAVLFLSFLLPFHHLGIGTYGFSVVITSIWLIRNDVARLNSRKEGFNRYMGVSILVGYAWLIVHAVVSLFFKDHPYGYDLYIHTFFLGFAFSMIWAHAPIILPAVLKLTIRPYHPIIWIFWILFQITLIGRVTVTLLEYPEWRSVFSLLNGISIILLFLTMGILTTRYNK